ncbi:MAG: hypothetical protein ABI823_17130, partial [Bryobacteraceae bacterium]
MSANLKIRTMNTLLLGAALLTPLAAQDRNRNDRNDSRGAGQGRYQSQGQRQNTDPARSAVDNRNGYQNRGTDNRNSGPARQVERAPQADYNRNGYANRGSQNRYDDR